MNSRFVLWAIVLLATLSIWINLPSPNSLPKQLNVAGREINLDFLRTDQWRVNLFGKQLDLSFLTPGQIFGNFPVRLGLDLQGGTELVLQTDMQNISEEEKDTALESAKGVIERRVNLYGVSESVVRTSRLGNERRLIVELPGVKDSQTAIALVGQTAQLEFREMAASPSANLEDSLDKVLESGLAEPDMFGTIPTGLTGADLKKAQVTFGSGNSVASGAQVSIEFTPEGTTKFAEITKKNLGKPLAIYLDGQPLMWPPPIIKNEILTGQAVLSGEFTPEQAKYLAIQLNAGALPVPIEIIQQRSIGAALGEESVQKGMIAGGIGLLTVMIFMVAYYGLYGMVANIALILYTLFILVIFRTGLFILPPVTLTLAGIAGFVLSIGMAVDANILTFERIKEELQSGKSKKMALQQGFARAWTSIRDSNVSSLITASILYFLGTSVVKGFALTLSIGVLVSMFSAIIVTRTLLRLLPRFNQKT